MAAAFCRLRHHQPDWAMDLTAARRIAGIGAEKMHYLEIIDTRHGGKKTGQGAAFTSADAARSAFSAVAEVTDADFLLDLHVDGGLVDTKHIDAATFERLTGVSPKSPDEYDAIDAAFWSEAIAARVAPSKPTTLQA